MTPKYPAGKCLAPLPSASRSTKWLAGGQSGAQSCDQSHLAQPRVTNVTREDSSAIQAAKFALQSAMGVYSLDYQMYHHFPPPLESARDLSSPLHRGPSNLAQAWHQYHVLHTNEYAGLQRLQSTKCMGDLRLQSHPRQQRDTVRCDTAQNQAAEARAPHQAATLSSASS